MSGTGGHPFRDGAPTKVVALRLTPEERERYQRAADLASLDLSTWIRAACADSLARDALFHAPEAEAR